MTSQHLIAAALWIGGAAYLATAWYVFRRWHATAGKPLLAMLTAIFIWSICYAIELMTRTVAVASVWSTLKYVGIVMLTPAFTAFVVEYSSRGHRKLSRKTLALLSIEPIIVIVVLAVPAWHDWMLVYHEEDIVAGVLDHRPIAWAGPLFWPHALYNYVILAVMAGVFVRRMMPIIAMRNRAAAITLAVATLLPFAGNIAYNLFQDVILIDPTPFLFVAMAIALVWGLFRMGFLDLMPVARASVLEQLPDCVLVLDDAERIIDINPAGRRLLGRSIRDLVGRPLQQVLPSVATVMAEPAMDAVHDVVIASEELAGAQRSMPCAVQVGPLTDRGGLHIGKMVVVRDITQRAKAERQLRELLENQTKVASALKSSLRPATLPQVPGVAFASRTLPIGEDPHVSGDFYDVHLVQGGDWAFVLGDVVGKGIDAAAVTTLARYTVRSLSSYGHSPATVVQQLNTALINDVETDRFCTMVYGRLTHREQGGVRLCVVLGGHPPLLIRRLDGSVEAVGRPGTALGVIPDIDVAEVSVELASGEVMLAYTDGVTEARRDGVEFGEQTLMQTLAGAASGLRGRTGEAAATLVAEAVADRVLDAVGSFAVQRDDIAVVVMAVA